MTTSYTARIELATREDLTDRDLAALASYRPAVSRGPRGHLVIELALPADDVVQAVQTAVAVVARVVDSAALSVTALPADESDRRARLDPVPRLLSVSEVATELGVSRQAVLQRIDSGSLPATRVGTAWAVQAAAVEHARRANPQRESLADVAATWDGAGHWPKDEGTGASRSRSGPDALDPLPLPPGATIGTTV